MNKYSIHEFIVSSKFGIYDQFRGEHDPIKFYRFSNIFQYDAIHISGDSVLFGFVVMKWAYELSRFGEQIDAIGSKRKWSEVEPADWKVG